MNKLILGIIILILGISSCRSDKVELATQNDILLENAIKKFSLSGELDHFILPKSNDYNSIPTSPENPITPVKVALGKFLFFETGLGLAPMQDIGKRTYSCGSCHIPSAGFKSGRIQGIGEGGVGFGVNGEVRVKGSLYDGDELDAQPIRTPTAMNGAYQKVMLWNGQFGGTGVNIGLKLNGLQIHQEKLII